ncbi:MAG: uracil-DNA glycosylase [Acidobacteria bacterium]|nr:MAG: uracil-DNA glycosylase [Acidobacteriota bacterium]
MIKIPISASRIVLLTTTRQLIKSASGSQTANARSASLNGSRNSSLKVINSSIVELSQAVVSCTLCPRLVAYRQEIGRVKRRAYMAWEYWAKPVPGFGDPKARVLILGLAPGAHGSNRTGRPFTGDGSGDFMYPVLHETGFASQPQATNRDDGMKLTDAYITAAVRCAPPANKPNPEEIANCAHFLDVEIALLPNVRVVVALGKIGFDAYLNHLRRSGVITSRAPYEFRHGVEYRMPKGMVLLGTYHPSLQNTNTGKLTTEMFRRIFERAKELIHQGDTESRRKTESGPRRRNDVL